MEDLSSQRATVKVMRERPGTRFLDWKVLWSYTGPGFLMSIAYLDPGNLEADLQVAPYLSLIRSFCRSFIRYSSERSLRGLSVTVDAFLGHNGWPPIAGSTA